MLNSRLWPNYAYMLLQFRLSLVEMMACSLYGTKTLSAPKLNYCKLQQAPLQQMQVAIDLIPKIGLKHSSTKSCNAPNVFRIPNTWHRLLSSQNHDKVKRKSKHILCFLHTIQHVECKVKSWVLCESLPMSISLGFFRYSKREFRLKVSQYRTTSRGAL